MGLFYSELKVSARASEKLGERPKNERCDADTTCDAALAPSSVFFSFFIFLLKRYLAIIFKIFS